LAALVVALVDEEEGVRGRLLDDRGALLGEEVTVVDARGLAFDLVLELRERVAALARRRREKRAVERVVFRERRGRRHRDEARALEPRSVWLAREIVLGADAIR